MTVVEELYRPYTTIVNEMLKLRAKLEHCMVVDLLMVFITIVNETLKLRTKLERPPDSLWLSHGCIKIFYKRFAGLYNLFFPCLNFILKCQCIDYFV